VASDQTNLKQEKSFLLCESSVSEDMFCNSV